MPSRRVLQGALAGFLGTYASRYSDFEGFWLFGFLVSDFPLLEIDLLGVSECDPRTPDGRATALARARFREQIERAGLSPDVVKAALLVIQRERPTVVVPGNGQARAGFEVRLTVTAVSNWGRVFRSERRLSAFPYDRSFSRSLRVT